MGRSAYHEMCGHVSLRFRLLPYLLSPRLAAAAAVVGAADVVECTRRRRATKNSPRVAHGEGVHDYNPMAGLRLLLYFPGSARIPSSLRAATRSPPESSDDGGTEALPAAPSVGGH